MRDPKAAKISLLKYENSVHKIRAKPRTMAVYDMILCISYSAIQIQKLDTHFTIQWESKSSYSKFFYIEEYCIPKSY